MTFNRDLVTWSVAVVVAAVVGAISGFGGARLGAALTGSVIALTAVVVARLVLEERSGR